MTAWRARSTWSKFASETSAPPFSRRERLSGGVANRRCGQKQQFFGCKPQDAIDCDVLCDLDSARALWPKTAGWRGRALVGGAGVRPAVRHSKKEGPLLVAWQRSLLTKQPRLVGDHWGQWITARQFVVLKHHRIQIVSMSFDTWAVFVRHKLCRY